MKLFSNKVLILVAVFLSNTAAFAGPGNPPPPPTPPPPGLPIDGAILLLVLVSLGYGLYKINKFNKKQNASN